MTPKEIKVILDDETLAKLVAQGEKEKIRKLGPLARAIIERWLEEHGPKRKEES